MHSQLLRDHGLVNLIGGSDYNFRLATTAEASFKQDINRLLTQAEVEPKELYTAKQIHSTNIAYCDGKNGASFIDGRHFEDTDGLITDQAGVALLIKFADCTPIVLFDPIKRVQASIHSGWRGTANNISQIAIEKMVQTFGSKKEDILAYVGPSIDQQNYEVGPEVYAAFSKHFDRELYFEQVGEKYLLDLSLANYQGLINIGLPVHNIEVATASTYTSNQLHSARKEGDNYGLNAIVTAIF